MSTIAKLFARLASAPDHVPADMVRYHVYWKVFYVLTAFGHLTVQFFFYLGGVDFMVAFNVFSVAVFITAFMLLRAGYYRVAFWGALIELVLHGIVATLCVGPEYGFLNYTFLVCVLVFIQPFYSWPVSTSMAALTLASAVAVTAYMFSNQPIYELPPGLAPFVVMQAVALWPIFVLIMVLPFIWASERAEAELSAAYGESERLLLNILPKPVAARLKAAPGLIADDRDKVAILFADVVGFTDLSARVPPTEIITLLNSVFNVIDGLVEKHGVEKIKTIGDAYLAVAGLPDPIDDPETTICRLALDINKAIAPITLPDSTHPVQIRIGLHSGRVVAGVIGQKKFAYDLWGDAVNFAARMESTGEPGRIQVTREFADIVGDKFVFEPRGTIAVKGKGEVETCFLVREKE